LTLKARSGGIITQAKVLGFTTDPDWDLDMDKSNLYSVTKPYVVVKFKGERYPTVLRKNGEITRGGTNYKFEI
jgi:hypothetical protein